MNKIHTNRLALIIGLLIILSKIYIIDIDPPKFEIAQYQPADELYYVLPAYDYYETGNLFKKGEEQIFGVPILSNIATYFSLKVFGDNYLGLRFSSIFFALIIVFFVWKILVLLKINPLINLGAILFLSLNYAFTLSNIVVEPTIARMASVLVSVFLMYKWNNLQKPKPFQTFILTLFVAFLWLFTYPTNAFIILSLSVVFYFKAKNIKNKKYLETFIDNYFITKIIFPFILGLLVVTLMFFMLFVIFDVDFLTVFSRGDDYSNRVSITLKTLITNIYNIKNANIFLFNPFLFFLFISAIVINTYNYITHKTTPTVIAIVIYSFIIQTIFINDFSQRKLIILLPLIIVYITNVLSKPTTFLKDFKKQIIIYLILALILITLTFFRPNRTPINLYGFIVCIILMLSFLVLIILNKYQKNLKLLFYIFLVLEISYTINYTLFNSTKNYKNASISLKEYNNLHFIGGFSYGFRVYNNIIPSINTYLYYDDRNKFWKDTEEKAKNNMQDYSIGYKEEEEGFKKINFVPFKTLIKAENSVYIYDIVIYKEKRVFKP